MTPIEILLRDMPITPIENPSVTSDMPYATHTGVLKIGDAEIDVCVLNDGRRIISEDALVKVFGDGILEIIKPSPATS